MILLVLFGSDFEFRSAETDLLSGTTMSSSSDNEAVVKAWASAYSSEVLAFARPEEVSNEEVFADVYHSLIHSAGLSATLLQAGWQFDGHEFWLEFLLLA